MKRFAAAVLLLFLVPGLAMGQKKPKKPAISAVFAQARYVYVEAVDGNEFNPDLYPADREAIANVEKALQAWKRYVLTVSRQDADLVFVVRSGRLAGAGVGYGRSAGPGPQRAQIPGQQYPTGSVLTTSAEAGPPDDLLEVCQRDPDGTLSVPLWIRTEQGGLDEPGMPLFRQLKDAVDRAYPPTQAKQTKKP